jgi:hypothetical protein
MPAGAKLYEFFFQGLSLYFILVAAFPAVYVPAQQPAYLLRNAASGVRLCEA